MRIRASRVFVVLACLIAMPSLALAQSAIARVVSDASGGVLQGVILDR